jgi:hypothetical protein
MADNYEVTIRLTGQNQMSGAVNAANRDIDRLATNTRTAGQASTTMGTNFESGMARVRTAITGAASILAATKLAEIAGEMVDLGQDVETASNTFEALTGGATEAESALSALRTATGGVVDDLTLMQGANKFLLMGLASSTEEATKLATAATVMGRAMNMDAKTALSDFAALLANQSIPRLDNFGISSDNVRRRLEELKAAGMGAQEAFASAVLAEYEQNLNRLGDSVDANISNIDVLRVGFENLTQDIASGVYNIVNEAAGTLNMIIALADAVRNQGGEDTQYNADINRALAENSGGVFLDYDVDSLNAAARRADELLFARRRMRANAERENNLMLQAERDFNARMEAEAQRAAARQQQIADIATGAFQDTYSAMERITSRPRGGAGESLFYTPEELSQVQSHLEAIEQQYAGLQSLAAQGLISEAELEGFGALRDQTADWADEVERGVAAFERMTLAQALGEGGGGMVGEVLDDVLERLKAAGVDEETLGEYTDTFNLASGRMTEASLTYRDQVVPLLEDIANQYGPEAAAEAASKLADGMARMRTRGDSSLATGWTGYHYFAGDTNALLPIDFDPLEQLTAQMDLSSLGTAATNVQTMADNAPTVSGSMSDAATNAANFETSISNAASILEGIAGTVNEVTLKLNVIDPAGLLKLLNLEGLLSLMGGATRDNGGLVPGQTLRAGRTAATT